jgi:hypothetical protein
MVFLLYISSNNEDERMSKKREVKRGKRELKRCK